jgi:hypothetical protein
MTYAIGKNKITCSSPGGSYRDNVTGLMVVVPGCSQPGDIPIIRNDTVLEYCGKCAVGIWREEDDGSTTSA